MRLLITHALALSLSVGLCADMGLAQGTKIRPEHHAWGRFKPGAWKLVRVVEQTLDEKGEVSSTRTIETKATLLEVAADGATLEIEGVQEVAGKISPQDPTTFKQGFHGELLDGLKTKESGSGEVVIEGRKIPCKILQLECSRPTGKTVTKIYYCPEVAPYILKRESVTSSPEGGNSPSETIVEEEQVVVALSQPCNVKTEIKDAALVKVVEKRRKGTIIMWALTSADVPGGVFWHSSKELDKSDRVIRGSTLELIEYDLQPEAQRPRPRVMGRPSRWRDRIRRPPE